MSTLASSLNDVPASGAGLMPPRPPAGIASAPEHAEPGRDHADEARVRLADALVRTGGEDRQAFRTVYELTAAKLFGICLFVCEDRQAAEDVLQDVYLTIWKRAGAWDPARGAPVTWLAAIARNRAIDWRRSSRLRWSLPIDDAALVVDPSPDAETTLLTAEADRDLRDRLAGLDDRQRDAINAAFFHGATYAELASARGVPLGTMKGWVRRGLLQLRNELQRQDEAV